MYNKKGIWYALLWLLLDLFELVLTIRMFWYFIIQDTGVVILGSQYHGYWWPGSMHHQDISQNGIGPVSLQCYQKW